MNILQFATRQKIFNLATYILKIISRMTANKPGI